jgi:hypothetical protein
VRVRWRLRCVRGDSFSNLARGIMHPDDWDIVQNLASCTLQDSEQYETEDEAIAVRDKLHEIQDDGHFGALRNIKVVATRIP